MFIQIADERDQGRFLDADWIVGEQRLVELAVLLVARAMVGNPDRFLLPVGFGQVVILGADLGHPARVQMQHLVAPDLAGQGVAGVHTAYGYADQTAGLQQARSCRSAGEQAAAGVHGADREGVMAVRAMAGAAVARPSAFDEGHARVTPEFGGRAHAAVPGCRGNARMVPCSGQGASRVSAR